MRNNYRSKSKQKINLIIKDNDTLYPIEIKKSANPNISDAKHFHVLEDLGEKLGTGTVISTNKEFIALRKNCIAAPYTVINGFKQQ